MSLQPIQQTIDSLQAQITMWTLATVAAIAVVIILIAIIVVKNFLRTKEGKIIDAAKGKRSHLVLAASLGAFAKLMKASDFNPEGALETVKFKNRWKKKSAIRKIYNPPKKVMISLDAIKNDMDLSSDPTSEELAAAELTRELAQKELNLTNDKVFLEGCRIPISVAVEDKVVWSGVKGLGADSYYEKLERVQHLGPKIKALASTVNFKDVADVLEQIYNKISLVRFDIIRSYFGESYDQSNDKSQKEYHYTMGFNDGVESVKQDKGGMQKMWMYMGIIGIIGGCVIAAIGLYLGK